MDNTEPYRACSDGTLGAWHRGLLARFTLCVQSGEPQLLLRGRSRSIGFFRGAALEAVDGRYGAIQSVPGMQILPTERWAHGVVAFRRVVCEFAGQSAENLVLARGHD